VFFLPYKQRGRKGGDKFTPERRLTMNAFIRKKLTLTLAFLIFFLVGVALVSTPMSEAKGIRLRTRGIGARSFPRRSIADLTKAIQRNPKDADAYYNRGVVYYHKGDYEPAIADLTRAIEFDPDDTDAYIWRGAAYYAKGDYGSAITDFTKAIEFDPDDAVTYSNRGTAYSDKGDYDRAIIDFNKTIELKPRFAEAYNNRGTAYSDKGDYGLL
jgi:tetratricopeptide (TPR) repeat protein